MRLAYQLLKTICLLWLLAMSGQSFAVDNGTWTYDINADGTSITLIDNTYSPPTNLVIPETIDGFVVTAIGRFAFGEKSLTSVSIPNTVKNIGDIAFDANQLTTITIPNGVTKIGTGVFRENQLTSVIIPDGVRSIGRGAFRQNQLSKITIPNSVISIGGWAFFSNNLTSIYIPDSVAIIEDGAFLQNQLSSVTLPVNISEIGNSAFADNALAIVNFEGDRPSISVSTSFTGNSNLVTIEHCSTATGWPGDSISNGQLSVIPTSNLSICPAIDSDNDGVEDNADAFPNNPTESVDTDEDGIGNNSDPDDDNDGLADEFDDIPLNPNETADTDGDGIGNNTDLDDDGDGVIDTDDFYPLDSTKQSQKLLDIDGNDKVDALTDGLVILRYVFGLRGDLLIEGIVAGDATRTSVKEIEAYLATLMPSL